MGGHQVMRPHFPRRLSGGSAAISQSLPILQGETFLVILKFYVHAVYSGALRADLRSQEPVAGLHATIRLFPQLSDKADLSQSDAVGGRIVYDTGALIRKDAEIQELRSDLHRMRERLEEEAARACAALERWAGLGLNKASFPLAT